MPGDGLSRLILPNGRRAREWDPLTEMAWRDQSVTYAEDGEKREFSPADILVAAARMLRDGKSLDFIIAELDVKGLVTYSELERAIKNVGMPLLEKRIAEGKEQAETMILVHKDDLPLNINDKDE